MLIKEAMMICPKLHRPSLFLAAVLAALVSISGCTQQEAADSLKEAEAAAQNAAEEVADGVQGVVDEGEKIASDLGEKAQAFLAPVKEKFSSLEELKESPEQLKVAVGELLESIEQKADDIQLPETVSATLETLKEKLIALRDYLGQEIEQAKVDEHIEEIMKTVKSGLGFSEE